MNSNLNDPQLEPVPNMDDNQNESKQEDQGNSLSRRIFLNTLGLGAVALGLQQTGCAAQKQAGKNTAELPKIQGLDEVSESKHDPYEGWVQKHDRKIRVGLVGFGVCRFSAMFGFQFHPNVEVVAVSDLIPERCQALAAYVKCKKTYPSLEEMVKDPNIEAIFIATDAPAHGKHAMLALQHGKHVASAVPAVFGSIEEGEQLLEVVRKTGLKYMMFETSCFREDLYAMRQLYKANALGKIVYSEGEYWHYSKNGVDSYLDWRVGMPPMWYPTHNNAYYIGVTDGTFTDVSCLGIPSEMARYKKGNNRYENKFATEIAFFKTIDGGMSRQSRSSDTPGQSGEVGRIRGLRGTYYGKYEGLQATLPNLNRPPLPSSMPLAGHGGSHSHLTNEFIHSILEDRRPVVDIIAALNMTVPGIVAHESALRNGEWLKIPQYKW